MGRGGRSWESIPEGWEGLGGLSEGWEGSGSFQVGREGLGGPPR